MNILLLAKVCCQIWEITVQELEFFGKDPFSLTAYQHERQMFTSMSCFLCPSDARTA